MSLTHLREWIAPGYDHKKAQMTTEHKLYNDIFETEEFKTVQALCNGLKHLKSSPNTSYSAGLPVNEWPDVGAVLSWNDGPPSNFYVDGEDVGELLQRLVDNYQEMWFSKQTSKSIDC